MKIKYGIPSLSLKIDKVVLPGQDTDSNININTGPMNFEIEGDAKELVLYGTTIVNELKGVVEFIRECFDEEEQKREKKFNFIQNEIDTEVAAQMHVYEMSQMEKNQEYRDRIESLLDNNSDLVKKVIDLNKQVHDCMESNVGLVEALAERSEEIDALKAKLDPTTIRRRESSVVCPAN
jgi:predicted RNase H-like nuclease (RuvC/YqgF family)